MTKEVNEKQKRSYDDYTYQAINVVIYEGLKE